MANRKFQRRVVTQDSFGNAFHSHELNGGSGPGMVDQIPAHYPGRQSVEVPAILPVDVLRRSQPEKCFIHQCCGLKGVSWPFSAKAARRNPAQVRHQQFEKSGLGTLISLPPLLQ